MSRTVHLEHERALVAEILIGAATSTDNNSDTVAAGTPVLRLSRIVRDSPETRAAYAAREPVTLPSTPPDVQLVMVRDLLRAPIAGRLVLDPSVMPKAVLVLGQPLFTVSPVCDHPIKFHNLCTTCGQYLAPTDDQPIDAHVAVTHGDANVMVSRAAALEAADTTAARLRADRKLSLVLDLDQTLIHATHDASIGPLLSAYEAANAAQSDRAEGDDAQKNSSPLPPPAVVDAADSSAAAPEAAKSTSPPPLPPPNLNDVYRFRLKDDPSREYYVRLRPYLREFLAGIAKYYELHVYTMGSRTYADCIARIIDPDGLYLNDQRVLSRDESGSVHRKSLERLFPCDQSMVVAVDDRGDVWDWAPGLVRVRPYKYFQSTGDINAPPNSAPGTAAPGPGLAARSPVVTVDRDTELQDLLPKLVELNHRFYGQDSDNSPHDVRIILPDMKRTVLAGCVISFSGLIPKTMPEQRSDLWMLAISFGAKCSLVVDAQTTHLVARAFGTDKSKQALARNLPIISDQWLATSIARWAKQDESQYALSLPPDVDAMRAGTAAVVPTTEAPPGLPAGDFDSLLDDLIGEDGDLFGELDEELDTDEDELDGDDDADEEVESEREPESGDDDGQGMEADASDGGDSLLDDLDFDLAVAPVPDVAPLAAEIPVSRKRPGYGSVQDMGSTPDDANDDTPPLKRARRQ
ncbi:hypothetical protein BC828DRAFT_380947 [Blastocladiella britannica]|nr:hypothetical protein BC828DRAFT_380947 [Blastocladiella britannica]